MQLSLNIKSMFKTCLLIALLFLSAHSLHLRNVAHLTVSSSEVSLLLQNASADLKKVRQSIDSSMNSLNPYNQSERISSLQSIIVSIRQQLVQIYRTCIVPLNSQQYYCQAVPQNLATAIQNSLDSVNAKAQQLGKQQAITGNSSIKGMPTSIGNLTQNITKSLGSPGTVINSPPNELNQPNLLGDKWVLGNLSIKDISSLNEPRAGQNIDSCPIQKPFVDGNNNCMSCPSYYSIQTKSCFTCQLYDKDKHICKDPPINSTTNNGSNIASNGSSSNVSNSSGTGNQNSNGTSNGNQSSNINPINGSTGSSTNPNISMRISNPNIFNGLLLPTNTSFEQYKQSLLSNPQNQNLVPCTPENPFFDGTSCITCPSNQYFSPTAKVCQTCPQAQLYNQSTLHCEAIVFYSNSNVKLWTSIGTPPADILKKISETSNQNNSKSCPTNTPFYNGQTCMGCSDPTPIFSYDGFKCTACLSPSVFDSNIYSCVTPQRMQTNPASGNLILQGRSLNEWKTYYFNNQTADPQISDCPVAKPYFDGLTCINCPTETPYFNMQYRICQKCGAQTAYDASVRECLSTAGNIVTQNPNVLKMAAGIFA